LGEESPQKKKTKPETIPGEVQNWEERLKGAKKKSTGGKEKLHVFSCRSNLGSGE